MGRRTCSGVCVDVLFVGMVHSAAEGMSGLREDWNMCCGMALPPLPPSVLFRCTMCGKWWILILRLDKIPSSMCTFLSPPTFRNHWI